MSESSLTVTERAALSLGRFANERALPKRLGMLFVKSVTYAWVMPSIGPRIYADGLDRVASMEPDRGVVLVSNHRSFFDMYTIMLSMYARGASWARDIYFPVRSNFFYDNPAGVALNFLVSGGCMYPPIFRDSAKSDHNKDALDRVSQLLADPNTLVGLHPEGTRGKGPDPYELLPAQPGVGQIVLHARPIVIPCFLNGLPNDLRTGIGNTYRKNARRDHPIILVMGEQLDYSEFTAKKPRVALYKRCADKMLAAIGQLSHRERELRAACARGDISDRDPSWLTNRPAR